jgi:hypothetical protein
MDLLVRAMLFAVIVIVVLFAVYYALQSSVFQRVTQEQAASLVTTDLQRLYPSALINITNNTPSNYSGSWHIVASVILNATSPCPSYFVYTFDYPQFGFVYRVDNTYTNNCVVYGFNSKGPFIVSSFPVALTRAYALNIPALSNFINAVGFSHVQAYAHFYNRTSVLGKNYTNVWLVSYSSTFSNNSAYALISQLNGTFLASYNASNGS